MERKTKFAPGEYYHVYARGVEKRKIFINENDYFRFSLLLYLCNNMESFQLSTYMRNKWGKDKKPNFSDLYDLFKMPRKKPLVSIGAYCQIPNHIHILIKENTEGGITLFMEKLLTAFSMYFNKKYNRSGPLFTGRFKAEHVDDDNYLKYLFSYIHLNPVTLLQPKWKDWGLKDLNKTKDFLSQYKYSSYFDYMGKNRLEKNILDIDSFPKYFLNNKEFNNFINEWLTYKDEFNPGQRAVLCPDNIG